MIIVKIKPTGTAKEKTLKILLKKQYLNSLKIKKKQKFLNYAIK